MPKNFEEMLNNLGETTTGGSHDAVTFAGKGLDLLKSMLNAGRNLSKSKGRDEDDDNEDDNDEDEDDDMKKNANGGDISEEDEDPEDPADGSDDIISNHGSRRSKSSIKGAVSKNYRQPERELDKHFDAFYENTETEIDMVPAFGDLAKSVQASIKILAKGQAVQNASLDELKEMNITLAKGLRSALQSIASLSGDVEMIKNAPGAQPSNGQVFAQLNKGASGGQGRRLSKSEVEDALTEALNEGLVTQKELTKCSLIRSERDLTAFVEELPARVRERLA